MPNAFGNFRKFIRNLFITLIEDISANIDDTDFCMGSLEAQFYAEQNIEKGSRDTSTLLEIYAIKRNPVFRKKRTLYIGQWGLMG